MQETKPAMTEAVYYILLSLYEPLHGYGIMQKVEELTAGRVALAAGTLYGALNTLFERGYIKFVAGDDPRKKEYQITKLGKQQLEVELLRLKELVENGELLIGGDNR